MKKRKGYASFQVFLCIFGCVALVALVQDSDALLLQHGFVEEERCQSAKLPTAAKLQLQQDNAADRLRLTIPEAVDHSHNVTQTH